MAAVLKSNGCLSWGIGLDSQHPHSGASLQPQGIQHPFIVLWHVQTCWQNTHKHKLKLNKKIKPILSISDFGLKSLTHSHLKYLLTRRITILSFVTFSMCLWLLFPCSYFLLCLVGFLWQKTLLPYMDIWNTHTPYALFISLKCVPWGIALDTLVS